MTYPLCPSAEVLVHSMHLPTITEASVRKCVSRYTRPHHFSGIMKWLVYRLENAVKSIFGQSDWQKAKKAIQNHFYKISVEIVKQEKHLDLNQSKDELTIILKKNIVNTSIIYANNIFPTLLLLNVTQPPVSEELNKKIQALDSELFIKDRILPTVTKSVEKAQELRPLHKV